MPTRKKSQESVPDIPQMANSREEVTAKEKDKETKSNKGSKSDQKKKPKSICKPNFFPFPKNPKVLEPSDNPERMKLLVSARTAFSLVGLPAADIETCRR